MTGLRRLALALLAAVLLAPVSSPLAHELRPSVATLSLDGDRSLLSLSVNLEALIAEIGPEHADTQDSPNAALYDRLRRLPPPALARAFDGFEERLLAGIDLEADGAPVALAFEELETPPVGKVSLARTSRLELSAALPEGARSLSWRFSEAFGDSVLRLKKAGEAEPFEALYLAAGETAEAIPTGQSGARAWEEVARDYLVTGFEHILPKGLDHILFVVGLFLLNPRWRPLLAQVTCFTLAHSLTLALAVTGVVTLSPAVVEPIIAASIVYVALENLFGRRVRSWRLAVVFGFGLIHGLGFAGVLSGIGLPEGQFLTAIAFFNIGVELGQLAVIGICYALVGFWFADKSWYRARISNPASLAVALLAAYWVAERLA